MQRKVKKTKLPSEKFEFISPKEKCYAVRKLDEGYSFVKLLADPDIFDDDNYRDFSKYKNYIHKVVINIKNCDPENPMFITAVEKLGNTVTLPNLQEVKLFGGSIDKKIAKLIIIKLVHECSLITLDLSHCSFSNEALKYLLLYLKQGKSKKTLKTLILNDCGINKENISILVSELKNNITLKYLSLLNNDLDDFCFQRINQLLETNTTLLNISLPEGYHRWVNNPQVFLYFLFIRLIDENRHLQNTNAPPGLMQLPLDVFLLIFSYLGSKSHLDLSDEFIEKTLFHKNHYLFRFYLNDKYTEYRPRLVQKEDQTFIDKVKDDKNYWCSANKLNLQGEEGGISNGVRNISAKDIETILDHLQENKCIFEIDLTGNNINFSTLEKIKNLSSEKNTLHIIRIESFTLEDCNNNYSLWGKKNKIFVKDTIRVQSKEDYDRAQSYLKAIKENVEKNNSSFENTILKLDNR